MRETQAAAREARAELAAHPVRPNRHEQSLPGYLAGIAYQVRRSTNPAGATAPDRPEQPILVRAQGGDRYLVEIRDHRITVDQPAAAGGTDTGPTPTEVFVAGLAACIAHYAGRFLRRHGLPPNVTVSAGYHLAAGPARVGPIRVQVRAPDLPARLREPFAAVVEHCTVHNTLRQPPTVTFDLPAGVTRTEEDRADESSP